MPQKRQDDEQTYIELQESLKLFKEQGFKPRKGVILEDDPEMDDFWNEQLEKIEKKEKKGVDK